MSSPGVGDSFSPEARDGVLRALAQRAGGEVVVYGESVEGRPLLAARLPAAGGKDAPRVLCAANIHGVEFIAARVALGFGHGLLEGGGAFAQLHQSAEVWLAPCLNPDGYARTFESLGVGTVQQLRTNAHGVDLNRNFPLPQGATHSRLPFTGSGQHGAATYRGPSPLSEPETRHLHALMAAQGFHAILSLHSFMGTLIPARVTDAAAFNTYARLGRALFNAQPRWKYRRLASRFVDAFTGELEDHAHHVHHAWSCCLEVFPVLHSVAQHARAPSTFWRFNPRNVEDYVANDAPAMAAYFLAALQEVRPGG